MSKYWHPVFKIGSGCRTGFARNLLSWILSAAAMLTIAGFLGAGDFIEKAHADVLRYVDDSGQVNYVSGPEKVPEKYKSQLSNQKPLPNITKLPARDFDQQIKTIEDKYQLKPEVAPRGGANARGKVEIFVTDWCQYCRKLEAYLREKHVPFTRYNIEKSAKGAQLHRQLGGGGVPVLKIGSKVLHGFDQAAVASALNLN